MTEEIKVDKVKRVLNFSALTLSKRLEFSEYVMNNLSDKTILEGGNHNKIFLKFNTLDEANAFMMVFYNQIKRVRGIFATFDNDGNIHLKYKTKIDKY
jgi:hypothetical protein